jgi:predicted transcriptional regulator
MKKQTALKEFRTQENLASALKITQAAVSKWPDLVPEKQALKIDRLTQGKLKYDPELYQIARP